MYSYVETGFLAFVRRKQKARENKKGETARNFLKGSWFVLVENEKKSNASLTRSA